MTPSQCQMCNCNNHASSCVYDAVLEGGECVACMHNTTGGQCERCSDGYVDSHPLRVFNTNFDSFCTFSHHVFVLSLSIGMILLQVLSTGCHHGPHVAHSLHRMRLQHRGRVDRGVSPRRVCRRRQRRQSWGLRVQAEGGGLPMRHVSGRVHEPSRIQRSWVRLVFDMLIGWLGCGQHV